MPLSVPLLKPPSAPIPSNEEMREKLEKGGVKEAVPKDDDEAVRKVLLATELFHPASLQRFVITNSQTLTRRG